MGAAGRGVGGTLGEAVVRQPLTRCTSSPRGRLGRVAAVAGLTRWGPMGTYRGQWGLVGAYGDLWGPMGAYGDLW